MTRRAAVGFLLGSVGFVLLAFASYAGESLRGRELIPIDGSILGRGLIGMIIGGVIGAFIMATGLRLRAPWESDEESPRD